MSKLDKFIAIVLLISGYSVVYASEINKDQIELIRAIHMQNFEKVRKLIQEGVDPNFKEGSFGFTPLMYTTLFSSPKFIEIAELLLAAGAKVNEQAYDGRTALTLAAFYGKTELVIIFLMAGADINYKPEVYDKNAYELALRNGHFGTAEVLKEWSEVIKKLKEETKKNLDETRYLLSDLNQIVADYLFPEEEKKEKESSK